METVEIRVVLTDAAVAEILDAIANTSARLLARDPDAINATLKQRRTAVGGMLELARRLNAHRLVRALEAHADALTRQIQAL
jgi:glycerol-3-phosphate O-acyltransferase